MGQSTFARWFAETAAWLLQLIDPADDDSERALKDREFNFRGAEAESDQEAGVEGDNPIGCCPLPE